MRDHLSAHNSSARPLHRLSITDSAKAAPRRLFLFVTVWIVIFNVLQRFKFRLMLDLCARVMDILDILLVFDLIELVFIMPIVALTSYPQVDYSTFYLAF